MPICFLDSMGPIIYIFDNRSPSRHKQSVFNFAGMEHLVEGEHFLQRNAPLQGTSAKSVGVLTEIFLQWTTRLGPKCT